MSTGHVFHPGHDEWHGQTVVVFTSGSRTVVGRWDSLMGDKVLLRDVALHDTRVTPGVGSGAGVGSAAATGGEGAETREAWIARLQHYGIPVSAREFMLPQAEVARVIRLRDA
jgi:hypothetical protein